MSQQGTFNYDQTIRELESKIVALQKSSKKDLNDKEQIISSLKWQLTKAEHGLYDSKQTIDRHYPTKRFNYIRI